MPDETIEDLESLMDELIQETNASMVKLPIGSTVVYQGPGGKVWCTPAGGYMLELAGIVPPGPDPDDDDDDTPPDTDDEDNPYDWPPPTPPDNPNPGPPGDPKCKKTIDLIYHSNMARMERVAAHDHYVMPDIDKWPSGVDLVKNELAGKINDGDDILALMSSSTNGWLEPEVMQKGMDPATPELTTTVTYYHDQSQSGYAVIPLAGHNTVFIVRTEYEADQQIIKGKDWLRQTPPMGGGPKGEGVMKLYRASNGNVLGRFEDGYRGPVTLELDSMSASPPKKSACSNKNFDYTAARGDLGKISELIFTTYKGQKAIKCPLETWSSRQEDTSMASPPSRQIMSRVPTMDANCVEAGKKILYNVMFAKALEAKGFREAKDNTYGGSDARTIGQYQGLYKTFQNAFLDPAFGPSNVEELIEYIRNEMPIGPFMEGFQIWCANWKCNGANTGALQAARDGVGACDHRARVAVLVLNVLGLPARRVQNSCHAYVEYYSPGINTWVDFDLNGCDPGGDSSRTPDDAQEPDGPTPAPEDEPEKEDNGDDSEDGTDGEGGDGESDSSGKDQFEWNDYATVKSILQSDYGYNEAQAQEAIESLRSSDMLGAKTSSAGGTFVM